MKMKFRAKAFGGKTKSFSSYSLILLITDRLNYIILHCIALFQSAQTTRLLFEKMQAQTALINISIYIITRFVGWLKEREKFLLEDSNTTSSFTCTESMTTSCPTKVNDLRGALI